MINKNIIIGIVGVALVGAGVFVWMTLPSVSDSKKEPVVAVPQQIASTYATSTFSVEYQPDYIVNNSYVYDKVNPKKPIFGVKFTVPLAIATGTNLSVSDTGVSVEQLPRAKNCTGDIYLSANVRPSILNENGIEYSVATSSESVAGSVYEEIVYALAGSSPCTAVRYFIHTNDIGPLSADAPRAFDRSALLLEFDKVRASLKVGAPSAPEKPVTP